ncbi:tail protein X [Rhodoplanes sp. TEM]|uniref:Tail protein X n=1 Tax=Rhodoplanes tepidamans TaxID=200616 RepID=A0ABT5J556_RHOTP|nr:MULTISPECIES: tail protein X [Rhodoplanes]MDC7784751.1 tail protein X [Rhodoplanes tepidamans]MDC7982218.1 tail protein X [Rhodoplanes sp. TEM]MDQ0356224.1 phage tail protein X [Rhodoplanes tepidamans]
MAIATETIVVKSEGQSVDGVIWQRYRWPLPGIVELTLDINPGLAGLGPILPLGTKFELPIVNPREIVPAREVIALWD